MLIVFHSYQQMHIQKIQMDRKMVFLDVIIQLWI